MNKKHKPVLFFMLIAILLLFIPLVFSMGRLDTARIGLKVNLSESSKAESYFQVSNPSNESINVSIEEQGFTDLKKNKETENIILEFDRDKYKSFVLEPGELIKIPFEVGILKCGLYEGNIKFSFKTKESKTIAGLNSVVQINAACQKESPALYLVIAGTVFIILIVGFILLKRR
ncbi:MAG: hypothetical protein V1659_01930 [Candidatus Woesearchaeota archaeon]